MTALGIGPEARRRLSAPRIAEIVADELRRQIIDGELADGDLLPRQELLVEQFNVSLVSLREALRILETEGLVSVRRGNRGGAVVHAPAKTSTGPSTAATARAYARRYLQLPNYTRNLENFGFGAADFEGTGSDRLISQIIPNGSEPLRERIQSHLDAGADHVVLQPLDDDGFTSAALARLADVVAEFSKE